MGTLAARIAALEQIIEQAGLHTEAEIHELRRAAAPARSTGPSPAGG
jgi:hypothetical protein